MKNGRKEVLDQVTQAVMSDRNRDYAPPEDNFARIADLWSTYLDTEITPYDTAIMMVLLKVARAIHSPHLLDHVVDIAGYAACAADVLPTEGFDSRNEVGNAILEPDDEVDEGTPLRYNGEEGLLFAPTDPGHDYCVWLSSVSGKKARMTSRQWEQAIDEGAAEFLYKEPTDD